MAFVLWWAGPGPRRVLDVGCGPGRMLRSLASLGWEVVGLEPDASYRAAAARDSGVEVREGGFEAIADVGAFDVVLAVNDPFHSVLAEDARADALRRVRRALRPGGRFLLSGADFDWILAHRRPPREATATVDGIVIERRPRHEIDEEARVWTHVDRFTLRWPDGSATEQERIHRYAMIGTGDVVRLLGAAAFGEVETWPSWRARSPAPPGGSAMIVTARTPIAPDESDVPRVNTTSRA